MNRSVVVTIGCALVISVSAFAAANIIEGQTVARQTDEFLAEESISSRVEENYSANLSDIGWSDFSGISECCKEAKAENIAAYIRFLCMHKFTPEQLTLINKILLGGTTVQSLEQVYDFWVTTDEDFSVIEDICNMENDIFGEFWYEDAFNKITNNSHGELDSSDIAQYREKGVELDQISAANVLSRKSGCNIRDILDRLSDGTDLKTQAEQIYGFSADWENGADYDSVMNIAAAKQLNVPENVITSRKANLKEVVQSAESALALAAQNKIDDELLRAGLSDLAADSDSTEYLQNCDYPLSVKKALLNKGYTPKEIFNASKINTDDINQAAKQAREAMKNE